MRKKTESAQMLVFDRRTFPWMRPGGGKGSVPHGRCARYATGRLSEMDAAIDQNWDYPDFDFLFMEGSRDDGGLGLTPTLNFFT